MIITVFAKTTMKLDFVFDCPGIIIYLVKKKAHLDTCLTEQKKFFITFSILTPFLDENIPSKFYVLSWSLDPELCQFF